MKTCECGGELYRHGVTRYKTNSLVGIRYKCMECSKTFTQRMAEDVNKGSVFFAHTKPNIKDWRYA